MQIMEKKYDTIEINSKHMTGSIEDTDVRVDAIIKEQERLGKTDEMWRSNFKVLNGVVNVLKRKVGFKAEAIKYGVIQ